MDKESISFIITNTIKLSFIFLKIAILFWKMIMKVQVFVMLMKEMLDRDDLQVSVLMTLTVKVNSTFHMTSIIIACRLLLVKEHKCC